MPTKTMCTARPGMRQQDFPAWIQAADNFSKRRRARLREADSILAGQPPTGHGNRELTARARCPCRQQIADGDWRQEIQWPPKLWLERNWFYSWPGDLWPA